MSTATKLNRIAVNDYLNGELTSPIKHEYLGGMVYARAGGRVAHNTIATNIVVAVGYRLRGRKCRPFKILEPVCPAQSVRGTAQAVGGP